MRTWKGSLGRRPVTNPRTQTRLGRRRRSSESSASVQNSRERTRASHRRQTPTSQQTREISSQGHAASRAAQVPLQRLSNSVGVAHDLRRSVRKVAGRSVRSGICRLTPVGSRWPMLRYGRPERRPAFIGEDSRARHRVPRQARYLFERLDLGQSAESPQEPSSGTPECSHAAQSQLLDTSRNRGSTQSSSIVNDSRESSDRPLMRRLLDGCVEARCAPAEVRSP
jgi:hypothetical protein